MMVAIGAKISSAPVFSTVIHHHHPNNNKPPPPSTLRRLRPTSTTTSRFQQKPIIVPPATRRPVVSTETPSTTGVSIDKGSFEKEEVVLISLKDYFQQSEMLLSRPDGGPPRWFSPLECGSRLNNSPLLLFLPGIVGSGLELILHHQRLGEIFDIWCLHIPATDRTSFAELVKLIEKTVRSEYHHSPKRPIYLVGESFGGCLALAVAARNPDVDLILIIANPATSFHKSQLQPLLSMLKIFPEQLRLGLPYMLSLMTDVPSRMAMGTLDKGFPFVQTVTGFPETITTLSSHLSGLAEIFTAETLLWKMDMLESSCMYANSRVHAIRAQTLILCSGRDQLLPSVEEGERLHCALPKCDIRLFEQSGHAFFLENDHDLVTIIKSTSFYRRAGHIDYALDYFPPTPSEIKKFTESLRWLEVATSPVMLSTLENGKVVRNLEGIPSEGPVLFVGYHMMLGFEVTSLISRILTERNILIRGVAHPLLFTKLREGLMPDLSTYDVARLMGAVPVSAANLYKLFSSKSHILLYPGGMREALHRKGEEYTLFWPEQAEFVRMAARFGAKIIPFGAVGEDDVGHLLFDYDDQMKIPALKAFIEQLTDEAVRLRADIDGEVAKQDVHLPIVLPKLPGRFYYLFGKPIETEGRKQELRNKEKAQELYVEVKSEVESCLAYLKEKRESDPYRSILNRLAYQSGRGFESEVPTFDL